MDILNLDNIRNGIDTTLNLMSGNIKGADKSLANIGNNLIQQDNAIKQQQQQNAVNTQRQVAGQARDWLSGKGLNQDTNNNMVKPLMNLNFDTMKMSPGFNPGSMNTSPIQTVSPYQMSKDLTNGFQPKTNDWANSGIVENQNRFDNASNGWKQNILDMNSAGTWGGFLQNAQLANGSRQLMRQANEQLSNDKRYASANLENNNGLLLQDLNARRNNDIQSANINNDIDRINMQNNNSAWDRNLQTYSANQTALQNNNANQLKNLESQIQFNKEVPALQRVQLQQQLLGDLQRTGDTQQNRTNYYLSNKSAYDQAERTGDMQLLSSLDNKYRQTLEKQQQAIYNNPAYALSGITNPRAIVQPNAKLTVDAQGNGQVEYDKLPLDSPLLRQFIAKDPNAKVKFANSNVEGGIF